MEVVVGIDIGGSATKIVGFLGGEMTLTPILIKANDPLASLFGALGKFVTENKIKLDDIKQIMITGVGAALVNERIYGIPTGKTDEFVCIGMGGKYLSDLEKAVVVSMGTGTAFISANKDEIIHLGGSGIGGGTLMGLSSKLVGATTTKNLVMLASSGDLSKVDLSIGDISTEKISLPKTATASNFGKLNEMASNADISLGLLNMVLQTIGVLSYFAAKYVGTKDIVLTGKLSTIENASKIFGGFAELYNVNYIIPKNSEFATAAGAALCYLKGRKYMIV